MNDNRRLGDYHLIKQIGQGPLGAVFLAEHRFIKSPYALKVLPEELSSDRSFIQRFEEEIALLAVLDHPNIVKIHNISFDQGQYFLVSDCVVDDLGETTNLAHYMQSRDTPLDEIELLRLLRPLANALDYAHGKRNGGKGVAHRGIKLNNVLIGKGEEGIKLLLSDYGLSRIVGTGAVLTRSYKMIAEALGIGYAVASTKAGGDRYPMPTPDNQKITPLHSSFLQNYAFLAPEQKTLESGKAVDIKADIYAFGILTYYLLTGFFPEGYFEMPSERCEELKYDWDRFIKSCLQQDADKRPGQLVPLLEAVTQRQEAHYSSKPIEVVMKGNDEDESQMTASLQQIIRPAPAHAASAVALKPVIHAVKLERPETDPDPAAIFQIDTSVKQYNPERKEVKNIEPMLTDMVVIAGGTFYRGSNEGNRDEMPRHQVHLASFAIDIHPVTNEQFVRFLEVMGGEKDSNHHDIIRMRDSRIKRSGGKLSIESGYAKHPVVGVTWYGAVAYAKWIGKRLPTEAEWEVAARGGLENSLYPTGDEIEKSQANFFSSDTTAVMSYAPNGNGLYDMAGNVYEWCYDWYGYNSYEASVQEPENPKGPLQGVYRVLRGGCWKSLKEDLRCSKRHRNNPGTVNGTYGFRCAADVQ
jgi:formylglycine-generating enzyme required for sulfatase activity